MADGGFTIPGTQTKVPIWMIGAAALAGLGAWILSKNQPSGSTAQPSTAGIDAATMAQNFDVLRQELLDYIGSNYGLQNGIVGTQTPPIYPPTSSAPLGQQNNANPPPTGYPPAPTGPDLQPPVQGPAPITEPGPNPPSGPNSGPIIEPVPGGPPSSPGSGGSGSGGGARVLHFIPGVKQAAPIFGFPDLAFLTSPINPGDYFTAPLVRSTRMQPASGSFIGGKPGPARLPFHRTEG